MKQFKKVAAFLLALLMLLSLTVLPVFAEDGDEEADGEMTITSTDEETADGVGEDIAAPEEDTSKTDSEGESDGDTAETTGAVDTAPATGETAAAESKGLSTGAIVGIIVGAVALVAIVVLCIRFRENLGKFFRTYRSELKKVSWLPWDQTKKSTLVVLVVLIACAAAICLIDLGLSRGFLAFLGLFSKAA